jgi:undecaprenyl diphosphate synthase
MLKLFRKRAEGQPAEPAEVPNHIAFICDGNRRWAEERGLPAMEGHRAGGTGFEKLVDWFIARGVSAISFFIWSTENWSRSKIEVDFLMNLFYTELKSNFKHALEKGLRYKIIGSRERLPKRLADLCDRMERDSAGGINGTVVFALNYGGQDEIVRAANDAIAAGDKNLTKESFDAYLNTGDLPPIDMVVRTSDERRISNFMLWKLAYAELHFIGPHWPEFVKSERLWRGCLDEFARRNRRFGGGVKKDYAGKKRGALFAKIKKKTHT